MQTLTLEGYMTPGAVRLNPVAVRLRNLISSTARPLPPAQQISYHALGSHNDRGTRGGHVNGTVHEFAN